MDITLISTVHKEMGKCNADKLCEIIKEIAPEVIFLEALDETYSNYDHQRFSLFGVYHEKLEIAAIQKYSHDHSFKYVPVLKNELSKSFDKKYDTVPENMELKKLLYDLTSLTHEYGFEFLNSAECIEHHEEMRMLENHLLSAYLSDAANEAIDVYENSMLQNIYSYSEQNEFNTAIFMCGSGHRKSIIEKIRTLRQPNSIDLSWTFYGN